MFAASDANAEVRSGQSAPNCKLNALGGGGNAQLADYRGKVVYLDFWASWCGPCAQSFPFMNSLHKDLAAKGLEVLAINLDEQMEDATGFLTRVPAKFTVLADASGQCPQDFGVKAMPSTYLIDRKGVIHEIHLGFKPAESAQLRREVEALLSAPTDK